MQADFYTVYDSKVDATLVWYGVHLPGFKRTHAYTAKRSQDTFYNSEGTMAVSVTGSSGKAARTPRPIRSFTLFPPRPFGESDHRSQSAASGLPVTSGIEGCASKGSACELIALEQAGESEDHSVGNLSGTWESA